MLTRFASRTASFMLHGNFFQQWARQLMLKESFVWQGVAWGAEQGELPLLLHPIVLLEGEGRLMIVHLAELGARVLSFAVPLHSSSTHPRGGGRQDVNGRGKRP